ncbi:hypothetical protein BC443_10400 [Salinicola sp. MIT1003]|nr:hypothetical protein BC443_10400 [Salinicola sp. MIT1003]
MIASGPSIQVIRSRNLDRKRQSIRIREASVVANPRFPITMMTTDRTSVTLTARKPVTRRQIIPPTQRVADVGVRCD